MFRHLFQKDDPLKKRLLEQYGLNLLSVPRKNASIGDLYIREGGDKRLSVPSNIIHFFEAGFELPPITYDEVLADISGTISKDTSVDVGLHFLENFLNVLRSDNLGTMFRTLFTSAHTIKFTFTNSTRDYIDATLLLDVFGRHNLRESSFLHEEGRRYYIATGVVRSSSISVITKDDSNRTVDIKAKIPELVDPSIEIDSQSSTEGLTTFKGKNKLAFGIELYELEYSNITNRFRLKMVNEPFIVRGEEKMHKVLKRVLIGDSDDPFITII